MTAGDREVFAPIAEVKDGGALGTPDLTTPGGCGGSGIPFFKDESGRKINAEGLYIFGGSGAMPNLDTNGIPVKDIRYK